jgi:hypothetical protein
MEDLLARIIEDLVGRVSGPMKFRLILQPVMAAIFAIRSGLKDAKRANPLISGHCLQIRIVGRTCCETVKSMGRVFVFAIVMDVIYQFIIFRWFYPLEALSVAIILALVPYLLIRGPVNRIAKVSRKK